MRYLIISIILLSLNIPLHSQKVIHVSTTGDVNSLDKALQIAKQTSSKKINIVIHSGAYYFNNSLQINSLDFDEKEIIIVANKNEKVTFSGAKKYKINWQEYKNGIFRTALKIEFIPDVLFINGVEKKLARYPNYDSAARIFNGTSPDAISKERVKSWKNPIGGYFHAMHKGDWGSFHYKITGKDENGNLKNIGGWQNNRYSEPHKNYRFVENIFEELDAPNEWFYNAAEEMLYYYPTNVAELKSNEIELSFLQNLITLHGTPTKPLKKILIKNINFIHTQRTLFEPYEPLLRSDWQIHRDGAIKLENTVDIKIDGCSFTNLGAHAVMVSGFNDNAIFSNNHIYNIGQSGICFVGDTSAVKNPAFNYGVFVDFNKIDKTSGPKNNLFPRNCKVENNLIHDIGKIEKQSTAVEISMSQEIIVKNNTIYNTPRAGINIGDGTWGGHIIEYNDVFNTVLETGDHGAFNSWGRDRYWNSDWDYVDSLTKIYPNIALLDATKTTIIRNNRFRCDHGWDIDLDDGSSNYHIYNNICLNGGLKLREGFFRNVENNIIINNSFHPHVWFNNSKDIFTKNIVTRNYYPIVVSTWGKLVDFNLFPDSASLQIAQKKYKTDAHSIFGDPQFEQANKGNYTLLPNSPALKLGFKNIETKNIGVQNAYLKSIAKKTIITPLILPKIKNDDNAKITPWLNTQLRNVSGLGDKSAFGLQEENGVIVAELNNNIIKTGLQIKDVIVGAEGEKVNNVFDLMNIYQKVNWKGKMEISIFRKQEKKNLMVMLK